MLALLSDIHGHLPALERALEHIAAESPTATIACLGDVVDGGSDDAACIDLLRTAGIPCLRGNHDEIHACPLEPHHDEWLSMLPTHGEWHGWTCSHFSPRAREEAITNDIHAWNAFDDEGFERYAVGHAHVPALYAYHRSMGVSCEAIAIDAEWIELDPTRRHLLVAPSLAYNRMADRRPGFVLIDGSRISFRRLDIAPIFSLV